MYKETTANDRFSIFFCINSGADAGFYGRVFEIRRGGPRTSSPWKFFK